MNHIKEIEQAVQLFKDLEEATSKKAKLTLVEEVKGNEIAEKLVELLKDEKVKVTNLDLSVHTPENGGGARLQNYVRFMDGLSRQRGSKLDPSVFAYLLRFVDKDELEMYRAILSKTISLPAAKEALKAKEVVKKEEKDIPVLVEETEQPE